MENNTVKKETMHIAAGCILASVLMCVVFVLLKRFSIGVVFGAILGSAFAIGNFMYLGKSIEKALEMGEQGQAYLRKTYTVRVGIQLLCMVLAIVLPFIDMWAGIVPLFFPRLTIYAMQALGMYKPQPADSSKEDTK